MRTYLLFLMLCTNPLLAGTLDKPADRANAPDIQAAVTNLEKEWQAGNIDKVVILHVPTDRIYALDFTPSRLDSAATFCLSIIEPQQLKLTADLLSTIKKASAQPSREDLAVRWGFIFLTRQGERVFSVYVHRLGKNGFINGTPVTFDSNALFKWAEETLGGALR
jgi:hypothetical protein